MRHRLFVAAVFLFSQLPRAFVELRGHLAGFFRRAAYRYQALTQLIEIHPATMLTLSTDTRLRGLLFSPPLPEVTGVAPIFARTSSPFTN